MEGKNLQKDTENAVAQQSLCTTAIEPVLQSPCSTRRGATAVEAHAPQLESSPRLLQLEKNLCSNTDPAQTKIDK